MKKTIALCITLIISTRVLFAMEKTREKEITKLQQEIENLESKNPKNLLPCCFGAITGCLMIGCYTLNKVDFPSPLSDLVVSGCFGCVGACITGPASFFSAEYMKQKKIDQKIKELKKIKYE